MIDTYFFSFCFYRLAKELEGCYRTEWSESVVSENIDYVADTLSFFNPSKHHHWSGAKANYLHGIRGPVGGQKDLHWLIDKEYVTNRVQLRSKVNSQSPSWSKPFFIFKDNRSGYELSDLQQTQNAVKQQTPENLAKIEKGLRSCFPRMSEEEQDSVMFDFEKLKTPPVARFHWVDNGRFVTEEVDAIADANDRREARLQLVRDANLAAHASTLARSRLAQVRRGPFVVINDFVAVRLEVNCAETAQNFWIGKVISIDAEQSKLQVRWYNSPKEFGIYKLWNGRNQKQHISSSDVLTCFTNLTDSGLIPSIHRDHIKRCLISGARDSILPKPTYGEFGDSDEDVAFEQKYISDVESSDTDISVSQSDNLPLDSIISDSSESDNVPLEQSRRLMKHPQGPMKSKSSQRCRSSKRTRSPCPPPSTLSRKQRTGRRRKRNVTRKKKD